MIDSMTADFSLASAGASKVSHKMTLKEAAAEFESFFFKTVLKEARENEEDPLFESSSLEHFQEMKDEMLAKQLGKEGYLGFADLLARKNPLQGKGPQGLLK
ncbi:MAG: hypothetical protein K0S07_630 [Chlamydiales bacterium]|jgi:Rod binding domain-containing protein|nr:hypothetical protein [Chlamydiales bacterium]